MAYSSAYSSGFIPADVQNPLAGASPTFVPWTSEDSGGILGQIGNIVSAPGQALQSAIGWNGVQDLAYGLGGLAGGLAGAGALGLLPGAAGAGIAGLPSEAAASAGGAGITG